jgi:hypothetical protein
MTFYRSSLAKFLQFLGKRSNDSAAMAWAVEYNLNGTWDEPIDAFEAYLAMRALDPIPTPTSQPTTDLLHALKRRSM